MKHNLVSLVALSTLLLAPDAHALRRDAQCRGLNPRPEQTTQLDCAPSWFFKPLWTSSDWAAVICGTNRLVRLSNPSEQVVLPGTIDPVPTPDDRYLTTPGPLKFFPMSELRSGGSNRASVQPVYTDNALQGVYQSIGQMTGDGGEPRYRAITERPVGAQGSTMVMRDYQATGDSIAPVQSAPVPLCPGKSLKLPMMSKNGRELAALDLATGTTKLFAVSDDGSCSQLLDLGIATGKVDFNFDGSRIVFHVDHYTPNEHGSWFSGVSDRVTKNVMMVTLDRSGGQVRARNMAVITNLAAKGHGAYYPSFRRDGRVVYMNQTRDEDGERHYSINIINPDTNATQSTYFLNGDCENDRRSNSLVALGALWGQVCTQYSGDILGDDAAMFGLSMDPEGCRVLVNGYWNDLRTRVIGRAAQLSRSRLASQSVLETLTVNDLLAVCPRAPANRMPGRIVGAGGAVQRTAASVFEGSCRDCHLPSTGNRDPNAPVQGGVLNYENLTLDQVDEMLRRTSLPQGDPDRMPPGTIDSGDMNTLRGALQQRRNQLAN